ncbi:MAG: hypothetical protein JW913_09580 [Chitinispirillaceae bacterium]|nr:hypothetical protein [Chitinispirillaceae bacterium]
MHYAKMWMTAPTFYGVVILMTAGVMGQSTKMMKTDTAKAMAHMKQLKPQTTCPVTGDPIDKKLYVDYQGKRIYVCCSQCIASVKKDPEKYIKKLESEGQSVKVIGKEEKKAGMEMKSDTSTKEMNMKDMKNMKMMSDTSTEKSMSAGYWTCSMHPEVHDAGPGNCPKCGMKLEFKKTATMKSMEHDK